MTGPSAPPSPRALGGVCGALAVAAAAFWGASAGLPSLAGVALLALAAVAAVVATGGVLRRVVAALLAVVGVLVVGVGVPALVAGEAVLSPLFAVAGGVVLLAVGLFVVLREPRLPRLGTRYAAAGTHPRELDPDRAAWQDLDAGRDPTDDLPGERGDDPGGGPRIGGG